MSAAISALFFDGCPAAIPRGVRAIIVDAVETVFRRWLAAHVEKEGRVVIPIEGDASSAVVGIIFPFGIDASLTGGSPRSPFGREAISVFVVGLANAIFCPATTRLRLSASQISSVAYAFIAAITAANPACLLSSNTRKGKDGEPLEALTYKIYFQSAHTFLIGRRE